MDVSDLAYRLNLLESVFDANLKKGLGLIKELSDQHSIQRVRTIRESRKSEFLLSEEFFQEMDMLVPVHLISSLDSFLKEVAPCVVIGYLEGCYRPQSEVKLNLAAFAFKAFLSDFIDPQQYTPHGLRYFKIYKGFERRSYQNWEAICSLLRDLGVGFKLRELIEGYLSSDAYSTSNLTHVASYKTVRNEFEDVLTFRHDAAHRQGSLLKSPASETRFCDICQSEHVESVAIVGKSFLRGVRRGLVWRS